MTILKAIVVCLVLANVCYFMWERGIAKQPVAGSLAAAPTLKLASESGEPARSESVRADAPRERALAAGSANAAADGPRDAAAPSLLSNVKRCVSVGPFRDVTETAHAASILRGGGYDPRQRVAEGEVWAGVWVYLPLPASHASADQILSKLKSNGIDDALEMPGPNEGSVISLGLFSEPKRAQARIQQAQALGLNPGIADRKRTGNVYWIDIDLKPTDGMLNPADLQGESGRIVRLEVKGCPAAAGAQP